jgi:excisionase family DNA binding protein
MSEWLTTSQVGKMLGLTPTTVCRLCDEGKLAFIRPAGTQRRIQRAVVEAYLASLAKATGAKIIKTPTPTPTPTLERPVLRAPRAAGPSPVVAEIRAMLRRSRSGQHS